MPQDLPPQGGFPKIRLHRDVPHKTIPLAAVGLGVTAIALWGAVTLGLLWRERRELKREKMWARLYLLPLVQAEKDREWMQWRSDQVKKEAEIMQNVEGWKAGESVYKNKRWAPPTFDLDGEPMRPPVVLWVDSGEPL